MISEALVNDRIMFHEIRKSINANISTVDDDDFLPIQTEFSLPWRDRAYSWDVNCEEDLHPETFKPFGKLNQDQSLISNNGSSLSKGNLMKIKEEFNEGDGCKKSNDSRLSCNPIGHSSWPHPEAKYSELSIESSHIFCHTSDECFAEIFQLDPEQLVFIDKPIQPMSNHSNPARPNLVKNSPNDRSVDTPSSGHMLHQSGKPLALYGEGSPCTFPDRRVGVYTKEERRQRIEKFRQKKLNRIWKKQIKYDCRKRLADTRPRVKGRFVSRSSPDHADCSEGPHSQPIHAHPHPSLTPSPSLMSHSGGPFDHILSKESASFKRCLPIANMYSGSMTTNTSDTVQIMK